MKAKIFGLLVAATILAVVGANIVSVAQERADQAIATNPEKPTQPEKALPSTESQGKASDQTAQEISSLTDGQKNNLNKFRSMILQSSNAIPPGDFVKITRPFYDWHLVCYFIFQKDQACVVEQPLINKTTNTMVMLLRIGVTAEKQPILAFSFPFDLVDSSSPFRLTFQSGFGQDFPRSDWACEGKMCTIVTDFSSESFQKLFYEQSFVGLSYKLKGTDRAVVVRASVRGLTDAIKEMTQGDPIQQLVARYRRTEKKEEKLAKKK